MKKHTHYSHPNLIGFLSVAMTLFVFGGCTAQSTGAELAEQEKAVEGTSPPSIIWCTSDSYIGQRTYRTKWLINTTTNELAVVQYAGTNELVLVGNKLMHREDGPTWDDLGAAQKKPMTLSPSQNSETLGYTVQAVISEETVADSITIDIKRERIYASLANVPTGFLHSDTEQYEADCNFEQFVSPNGETYAQRTAQVCRSADAEQCRSLSLRGCILSGQNRCVAAAPPAPKTLGALCQSANNLGDSAFSRCFNLYEEGCQFVQSTKTCQVRSGFTPEQEVKQASAE